MEREQRVLTGLLRTVTSKATSMPPEALRGPEVSILDLATGILRRKLLVLGVPALLALAVSSAASSQIVNGRLGLPWL